MTVDAEALEAMVTREVANDKHLAKLHEALTEAMEDHGKVAAVLQGKIDVIKHDLDLAMTKRWQVETQCRKLRSKLTTMKARIVEKPRRVIKLEQSIRIAKRRAKERAIARAQFEARRQLNKRLRL